MTINIRKLNQIQKELENYPNSDLMVVTKNQNIEDIKKLIAQGQAYFGENRVQEAMLKYFPLRNEYKFNLSLIGPLQSNKTKEALKLFNQIQSIDRPKIVDEILKFKNELSITKSFFIQINIGKENQKSGVMPDKFEALYSYCINLELPIEGLMCIPPSEVNPNKYFEEMIAIRNNTKTDLKLSMGMSNDYPMALKNGSNILRIGSLIFK